MIGTLAGIATQLRWGLAVLAFAAVALLAWQANEWRHEAGQAAILKVQLEAVRESARMAEELRFEDEAARANEAEKVRVEVKEIIKRVPVYINRSDCTVSPDGVRAINKARGLPSAGDGPDDPASQLAAGPRRQAAPP